MCSRATISFKCHVAVPLSCRVAGLNRSGRPAGLRLSVYACTLATYVRGQRQERNERAAWLTLPEDRRATEPPDDKYDRSCFFTTNTKRRPLIRYWTEAPGEIRRLNAASARRRASA